MYQEAMNEAMEDCYLKSNHRLATKEEFDHLEGVMNRRIEEYHAVRDIWQSRLAADNNNWGNIYDSPQEALFSPERLVEARLFAIRCQNGF